MPARAAGAEAGCCGGRELPVRARVAGAGGSAGGRCRRDQVRWRAGCVGPWRAATRKEGGIGALIAREYASAEERG